MREASFVYAAPMIRGAVVWWLALATGCTYWAAPGMGAPDGVAGQQVETVALQALTPLERQRIPLDAATIAVVAGREAKQTRAPVALYCTVYDCRAIVFRGAQAGERRCQLFCYELVSDAPYNWAF